MGPLNHETHIRATINSVFSTDYFDFYIATICKWNFTLTTLYHPFSCSFLEPKEYRGLKKVLMVFMGYMTVQIVLIRVSNVNMKPSLISYYIILIEFKKTKKREILLCQNANKYNRRTKFVWVQRKILLTVNKAIPISISFSVLSLL